MALAAHRRIDVAACGLSAACLAHCLALPVAASLLPMLGPVADAEWIHWLFVVSAAPLAIVAFARRGTSTLLRLLAIAGVLLLIAGAAGVPDHDWETSLSVAGALCLAGAHTLNALKTTRRGRSHPAAASL